jgi:hypothetical protein
MQAGIIQLTHPQRLGYSSTNKKNLVPLAAEAIVMAQTATVLTFRRPGKLPRSTHFRKLEVHACTRLDKLPDTDIVFYGVETDSPLAPLLLWDAAHFLAVGRTITLIENSLRKNYLCRSYFQDSLAIESRAADQVTFRKIAPLPAEKDAGKNAWTFGIPVGPEDATMLNLVVGRILELNLPHKEILLCGRPAENFKYWSQVRIVGEDISAPPLKIS